MKRLKTLLGYYIPTFFEMQVDSTDDNAENGAYPPTLNGLIHPVLPLNWP